MLLCDGHCPLGRLTPPPSYSYSPDFFSSSTGCKSESGRHEGDGTVIILTFCVVRLLWCHPFWPMLRGSAVPCPAVGAHGSVTDTKSCASSSRVKIWLSAGSSVCSAIKLQKNIFLIKFFSYKGHLNDRWLSKQDILRGLYISPHSRVCFSCFGVWR